jgi:hypothetical protein
LASRAEPPRDERRVLPPQHEHPHDAPIVASPSRLRAGGRRCDPAQLVSQRL